MIVSKEHKAFGFGQLRQPSPPRQLCGALLSQLRGVKGVLCGTQASLRSKKRIRNKYCVFTAIRRQSGIVDGVDFAIKDAFFENRSQTLPTTSYYFTLYLLKSMDLNQLSLLHSFARSIRDLALPWVHNHSPQSASFFLLASLVSADLKHAGSGNNSSYLFTGKLSLVKIK